MRKLTLNRKENSNQSAEHTLRKTPIYYSGANFVPMSLSGVIVPWSKALSGGQESDYKLVCSSGLEYFIIADSEWQDVLSWFSWEDVRVKGLFNTSNMTLIPQQILPKNPNGSKENLLPLPRPKLKVMAENLSRGFHELVAVPAAMLAAFAA